MKNKFNYLILLIFAIFLTGCNINSDIEINEDFSVSTNTTATVDYDSLDSPYDYYEKSFLTFSKYYDELDRNLFNVINNSDGFGTRILKKYSSLDEFLSSKYMLNLYKDGFLITEENNLITITNKEDFSGIEVFLYGLNRPPYVDNASLNIKFSHIVTEHNADVVDEENNIYTWIFDRNSSFKDFKVTVNKDALFVSDIENKQNIVNGFAIFIVVIVIISVLLVVFVKKKGNKNNDL